jgi:hypothetical protein
MLERFTYGIAAAARMTGVPAETLRVWERRYAGLRPRRTAGGRRTYDQDDIAYLRLVAQALAAGHRPGAVLGLSRKAVGRLVGATTTGGTGSRADLETTPSVDGCVEAVRANDAGRLRVHLRRAALLLGVRRFVDELADPLAVRIGALWAAGAIAVRQEHLFAECLATQFRTMLAALEAGETGPIVLLTTFPGELHALGLDMAALRLASCAAAPRVLGPSCPPDEIAQAAGSMHAAAVGVSVSAAAAVRPTEAHLRELLASLGEAPVDVWLGGAGASAVRLPHRRVRVVRTSAEIDLALARLAGGLRPRRTGKAR